MGVLALFLVLLVIPFLIALPWTTVITKKAGNRLLVSWPLGFFLELAVFFFLTVPFTFLRLPFSSLCYVYTAALLMICVISVRVILKSKPLRWTMPKLTGWEVFYLVVALIVVGWQVYRALTLDRTYMSLDDATYVAMPNDALTHNALYAHDAYTGLYQNYQIHRVLQSWLVFPAYLSWISGISVVMMMHAVLDVCFLLMGYCIYYYMGCVLFKRREDALIFVTIVSVIYIYGNYSIYSQSFRFLGMNAQGKAVLAVLLFPLLFTMMIEQLKEVYQAEFGVLLLLLSAAACSLTLFGAVTVVANVALPVVFMLFGKKRVWKQLGYILWTGIIPVLCLSIFFWYRFAV